MHVTSTPFFLSTCASKENSDAQAPRRCGGVALAQPGRHKREACAYMHTTLTLEPKHASQRLQCEPWRNGQPFPRGQRWRLLAEARPQPSTCKERHTRKGPTGRGMSPERYVAYPHAKRISPPRIEKNAFWLLPMWAGHKLELSKTAVAKHRLRGHDAHVANPCD